MGRRRSTESFAAANRNLKGSPKSMVSVNRSACGPSGTPYYSQKDYDCQVCGAAETPAMVKRVQNWVTPTCDDCIVLLAHDGHKANSQVRIDHVTIVQEVALGPDNKERLRTVEKRVTKHIRYAEWDARCRLCFPFDVLT